MDRAADSIPTLSVPPPRVPAWAQPQAGVDDAAEAAYMAGGALSPLDGLVRSRAGWLGAWRHRLALKAAAASVRLTGRIEGEAALRDAWHLRRPGDETGPAGDVLAAWRRLAGRSATPDDDGLEAVAGLLGVAWTDSLDGLAGETGEYAASGAPAPLVAARVAGAVVRRNRQAEPLAWWMADLALSMRMRWPLPVPLLATQIHSPLLRFGHDRARSRPGAEDFGRTLCIALAAGAAEACRLAAGIDGRARLLLQAAPRLRSKGAGEMIDLLLNDDAVSGTLATKSLSRWASRRLFDRLVRLDAVRELSGRDTFRLYGL